MQKSKENWISNGQIRRWDNSSPKIENIQKVADYFDVSTDYLLGRTDKKRIDDIETIAAHHDGEDWTEEELEEIERFKEFVRMKRSQQEWSDAIWKLLIEADQHGIDIYEKPMQKEIKVYTVTKLFG